MKIIRSTFLRLNQRIRLRIVLLVALALVAFLNLDPRASAGEVVDLSGTGWTLWRDEKASWENDELFLPPVDLKKVPVQAPTCGWEALSRQEGTSVSVPGTAEEYLGKGTGPDSAIKGVTWWVRNLKIPTGATGKTVRLQFDSVRLRAEVYLNRKLVAYDLVGNTPFEADVTGLVAGGENAELAVRVTNPGGNYDWKDVDNFAWGKYQIPMGHGFGGISGGVKLVVSDPVYIDDLYVQNTPAVTEVNVNVTVKNTTPVESVRDVQIEVYEKGGFEKVERKPAPIVFKQKMQALKLMPGENKLTFKVSVPDAKLWGLENPNLYDGFVTLDEDRSTKDSAKQSFGFRWFAPVNIGSDAMLQLNGKRIFLRTAISWGFWPVNGLFPSAALAERQIRTAKAFGLNMLNFHRCIGNPVVFDKADELGLLYFEEPGGYVSGENDPFAQALCREKLLRMVKRDRSHPSLIIYNMINEQWDKFGAKTDDALFSIHKRDLEDAHALDPSRTLVYTSAWAGRSSDPDNDKAKMNMRPYDNAVYMNGWFDYHRASGPELWRQEFYKSPSDHYGLTSNQREIVYWGEEGAVSAPPRLGLIKKELEPHKGWDGQVYADWYRSFDEFLDSKNLRPIFHTVDDLCAAMGKVSIEHQGRKIEDTRICDLNDGYAINGWESELIENHSGVVDCYRNPKADPAILAYYNQPLYIAVKVRQQIVSEPSKVMVDFYAINEKNLTGPHTMKIRAVSPEGKEVFEKEQSVELKGGDVFGQLLAEAVEIPVAGGDGMFRIEAQLVGNDGIEKAVGHDEVLGVDWKHSAFRGRGAVFESGNRVRGFLSSQKGVTVPLYDDSQGPLDWLVIARPLKPEPMAIESEFLLDPTGKKGGLQATFYSGNDFQQKLHQRFDKGIDYLWAMGANPDPEVPLTENYCVRWEGQVVPPVDGEYLFSTQSRDGVRLWLDGQQVIDGWKTGANLNFRAKTTLSAGKPVTVKLEYFHTTRTAEIHLRWTPPD